MAGLFYSQNFCQKSAEKKRPKKYLRDFSMADLFYAQSFSQKSAEKKLPKKYFHIFILMSDLGY